MDTLAPMLMNFIEQQARPAVQTKVTEQLNSTKGDLKNSLPNTIMNYLSGSDGNGGGNAMISQLMNSLGPNFMNKVSSVTGATVDTASEGMDSLLTDGVMNIAKGVLTNNASASGAADGAANGGGFNFDFLTSGKDGMVNQTMAASNPVIKQVSDNMSKKISASFPAAIGGAIQQLMDQNGGAAGGAMGMAAGLMSKFMGGEGQSVNGGGNEADIQAAGGSTGGIQQMLQNLLAPKILLLIQPFMQKFEAQMTSTLENELRNKVFSSDYIKQTVMGMLTGAGGQGGGASALLGGAMNMFMNGGGGQNGQQGGNGQNAALGAMANMAGQFLKNRG
ncbi:hypothetical protein BGZ83_002951 [Gryganskiella cystojenkinii]|nr:hypothetical protein BGZ83_002951 [Gryganskiella cystojenkinii]